MREKLTQHKCISFTDKWADKIQNAADTFDVSFQDIVRACVENDLQKLIDRENKRTKRKTLANTENTKI